MDEGGPENFVAASTICKLPANRSRDAPNRIGNHLPSTVTVAHGNDSIHFVRRSLVDIFIAGGNVA